ncbi:hypothetical protein [Heyndrickxia sp. FSL W8-0423]|uniref:hypothetical protein n=1 Tax=Heyndrickxia sp. FSL W8-0423 TaxID=2921601 RepID=UPI0030F9A4D6
MAKLVCDKEANVDLALFIPVRSPIQPLTREEVITETVEHMLATGYESDWRIPVEWHNIIERIMYASYEKFTKVIHPVITPPAEILAASKESQSILNTLHESYIGVKRSRKEKLV